MPINRKEAKPKMTGASYYKLFNRMTEGFALNEIIYDKNGKPVDYRHLDVNPAFERYTGFKRKNVINVPRSKLLPINHDSFNHYCNVVATGKPVHFESYSRQIDKYRQVYAYRTGPGQFATVFTDITDRKIAERKLRDREIRYRGLYEAILGGVIVCDSRGSIIELNETARKIFGITLKEIKKRFPDGPQWRIINENNVLLEYSEYPWITALRAGKTIRNKVIGILRGQDCRWLIVNTEPVRSPETGIVYSTVSTFMDISERKKNESAIKDYADNLQRLNNDLKQLQLAVENASDLIIITDAEGKIIYANKAIKPLLGFSPSSVIGKKTSIFGKRMDEKFYQRMWQTIKFDKKNFSGEVTNIRNDGRAVFFELHISPILDGSGKVIFFVAIERDRTAAKEIDLAKTEFISLASHQLRTPLAMVSLASEMLLKEKLPEANEEAHIYLDQIFENTGRMTKLIDLFLNVSRIELGRLETDIRKLDVIELSRKVLEIISFEIKSKKITLETRFIDEALYIKADRNILAMALENLLSNACKYTPPGGKIKFSVFKKHGNAIFEISDTGRGIPKHQLGQIFTKMFRAGNTGDIKGVGLGLYIAKSTIEKNGGKVTVRSKENKGSSFSIHIPLKGMGKID